MPPKETFFQNYFTETEQKTSKKNLESNRENELKMNDRKRDFLTPNDLWIEPGQVLNDR